MHVHPSSAPAELFKRKDFWLAAYLAALHRLSADDAVAEADQALRRADQRWENAPTIGSWRYEHEYPVGSTFGHAEESR
ncbi:MULTISPECIES: hypothetical protein [unclassified Luteibacter]|uniref:hypothetical protein n=1 Tax=Luteibacter sp. PvP019 TaxID=3156436 RepID=UPI0033907993